MAGGRNPLLTFSVMHMKVMLGVRDQDGRYRMPIPRVMVIVKMLRRHSFPSTRKMK